MGPHERRSRNSVAVRGGRVAGALTSALLLGVVAGAALAYPLDGFGVTGIARLEAYDLAREALLTRRTLVPGALRASDEIQLRLAELTGSDLPAADADATRRLRQMLGAEANRYAVTVVDFSDPTKLRVAEHQGSHRQSPGSVGKILVALGWFQALADRFPDDTEARHALLRDTRIRADPFIRVDDHFVPIYAPGDDRVRKRPIQEGDEANLYTFLDWMLSASSNAAASMLMEHLLLFRHFGEAYPPSPEDQAAYLAGPTAALREDFRVAMLSPVERAGLPLDTLQQGSFFTREGKRLVPSFGSIATSHQLARYLIQMERGALVDAWSSLTLKRLLYQTDRRIRYASHPVLDGAAVYFKSGSLYSCQPEPDFVCKKYHGNVKNYMNSVAIVEGGTSERPLRYAVAVLSNILRKNSAVEHQTLALRIHRMVEAWNAATPVVVDRPPPDPTGAAPAPTPVEAPAQPVQAPTAVEAPMEPVPAPDGSTP